jgi:uncharacterized protein YneF (UPF0154 family)
MANTVFFIALGVTVLFIGIMIGMYIYLKRSERDLRLKLNSEERD